MDRRLDEVLQELDSVTTELQRTSDSLKECVEVINNLHFSLLAMAERVAMISYPGFLDYPDGTKEDIINKIANYYIELDKNYVPKHERRIEC